MAVAGGDPCKQNVLPETIKSFDACPARTTFETPATMTQGCTFPTVLPFTALQPPLSPKLGRRQSPDARLNPIQYLSECTTLLAMRNSFAVTDSFPLKKLSFRVPKNPL